VTVDDAQWRWEDASGNPVILQGLAPGKHKVLIELADSVHNMIDQATVEVTMTPILAPQRPTMVKHASPGFQLSAE
jgi:hypothetical protein